VRDLARERPGIPSDLLTDDPQALVTRGDVDVVIELMGGIDPARGLIELAIANGASVVTANKALMATHGAELAEAADAAGVDLFYEAAVAAAIPLLRPLRESLAGDRIRRVLGIVNGTTNYMLTKMDEQGASYDEVLVEAQRLGYAEADPTADVEGEDSAAKAAILATLAFHTNVTLDDVYREGITKVTPAIIESAREMGFVIKLLAVVELTDDAGVIARVHPAMVPRTHPLASVRDIGLGDLPYSGPTASLTDVWRALRASMRSVLEQTTLADVAAGALPGHVQVLADAYRGQEEERGHSVG